MKFLIIVLLGKSIIWIISLIREKNKKALFAGIIIIAFLLVLLPTLNIGQQAKDYIDKKKEVDYDCMLMDEFLSDISEIDPNATIICFEWWQEPDVSLFLDRQMVDINSMPENSLGEDNLYFIIGRKFDNCTTEEVEQKFGINLERVNELEVNYDYIIGFKSNELFSIYKVKKDD